MPLDFLLNWIGEIVIMQKTSFHLLLRVSKKAEVFSEDYFKKLYKSEEKAWLELQKGISNFSKHLLTRLGGLY